MKLFFLLILSLSIFAQPANPDALFLSDAQVKRLNDTQAPIERLTLQLELAKEQQKNAIFQIQLELAATPDKFESLALIDGKLGFKRKAEPPKPDTPKP